MIIDSMANASRYASLHPLLADAFAWISITDLDNEADGKSDIADGLKAIISTAPRTSLHLQNVIEFDSASEVSWCAE